MRDLRNLTQEEFEWIGNRAEENADLLVMAIKKFYGKDQLITVYVVDRANDLCEQAKRLANERGLVEKQSYEFRKEFIEKYLVDNDPL